MMYMQENWTLPYLNLFQAAGLNIVAKAEN